MTAGKINFNSPSNLKFYHLILFIFMDIIINFDGYDYFLEGTILFYSLLNLPSIIFI
jgi:hypothetical protein